MKKMTKTIVGMSALLLSLGAGCSDEGDTGGGADNGMDTTAGTLSVGGDGDGDGDGDGEGGDASADGGTSAGDGDSDSDSNSGGDGDGDSNSGGDGDGDSNSGGDGDGDSDSGGDGDGDGDPGGDGDGDGDPGGDGDGDGDPGGDGDGDGDPGGDGDGDIGPCQAPADHITCDDLGTTDIFNILGLNCPGTANNSVPTLSSSVTNSEPTALVGVTQYGTTGDWVPTEGAQALIMSTSILNAPDANGLLVESDGANPSDDNGNPDLVTSLPTPMSPNPGWAGAPFDNCDGVNDCSGSLQGQWTQGGEEANDLMTFQFSVQTPGGTNGWELDFVYFSAEFPEWVDSSFNDIFAVWVESPDYTGNMCFVNNEPCTVTALDGAADAFTGVDNTGHPSLAGTGFQGWGQTTGQYTILGPATPNSPLTLTFAIFDMADRRGTPR